jgi:hypothetical protein
LTSAVAEAFEPSAIGVTVAPATAANGAPNKPTRATAGSFRGKRIFILAPLEVEIRDVPVAGNCDIGMLSLT